MRRLLRPRPILLYVVLATLVAVQATVTAYGFHVLFG